MFDNWRFLSGPKATLEQDSQRSWYRIENRADEDAVDLYIFDLVGKTWDGGVSANDFVRELKDVTASVINLHLNSRGGDVFEGLAIYNALKQHDAEVNVSIEGLAASIASVVAMAGDTIIIAKNAQVMIHEAHAIAMGNAEDMKKMAALLDESSDNIASIYADRAGGTVASWRRQMKAETWLTGQKAVDAGLADEMMPEHPKRMPAHNSIETEGERESEQPKVIKFDYVAALRQVAAQANPY